MTEPSDPHKRPAPRGGTPPAKKQDTGTRRPKIEDKELLDPLDAFFRTEEELWKEWEGHTDLKDAAMFSFHAQEFLVFSLTYEVLIVVNYFPRSEQYDDQSVEFYGNDIKVILESLQSLGDIVTDPPVRLAEDKAKDLNSIERLAIARLDFHSVDEELHKMSQDLHKYKDKLKNYKGSGTLSVNQQKEVGRLSEKLLAMVKLLVSAQEHLKDARNIDYHDKGHSDTTYPAGFEWKGKSSEQSKSDMENRKEELGRQFDDLVVVFEPQN